VVAVGDGTGTYMGAGGERWCIGGSSGFKGSMNMLSVSNSAKTAGIGHGNGMGMYLGAEYHRNPMDGLNSKTDAPRGQMGALNALNSTTTASMGHSDNAHMYLGAGGMRVHAHNLDGFGSHADASIGHGDIPSIDDNVNTAKKKSRSH